MLEDGLIMSYISQEMSLYRRLDTYRVIISSHYNPNTVYVVELFILHCFMEADIKLELPHWYTRSEILRFIFTLLIKLNIICIILDHISYLPAYKTTRCIRPPPPPSFPPKIGFAVYLSHKTTWEFCSK